MATSAPSSPVQRFGGFEVDPRSRELRRKGVRIRMQDQPLEVLLLLLARKGEVVTREELKQRLWPAGTFVDADDGLNTAVRKLREVLGDSKEHPVYIETIPRRGYRFIGSIEEDSNATSSRVEAGTATPAAAPPTEVVPKAQLPWPWIAAVLVLLAALAFLASTVLLNRRAAPRGASAISSLAVLPLQNLSGDPNQEYFADGITESLIGRLSMIRGLRVISRTSSMHLKNTPMSPPEIAKALNVDALVEGSVIRDGSRVRVHAQLIRAATDEHFWSETYDREAQDVLALESEVAQSIARKVEVTVTGDEHGRLAAARPVSPEVYESYLKGRQLEERNTKAEIEGSIAYFEDAIRKDPTFAPAYVGLADAYGGLGTVFIGMPANEMRPKLIEAARKALELDPDLASAHVQLADAYQSQWQWGDAEAEYQRALQLNPNDSFANRGYSQWLLCRDRMDEALAFARRARELDPLGLSGVSLGWILLLDRRYEEAVRELRSVVSVQPDLAWANWYLGFALIGNGQPEEAIPVLEKSVSQTNRSPGTVGMLSMAYAKAGRRDEAIRLINELKHRRETGYVPAAAFVFAVLAVGDREEAFVWLDRAYQEKSNLIRFAKVHPFFDPMRDDPRFADLIRRIGLAQ
jgi:TolB-like protein/DNA-binding winged helix-turn-helix (wHTH) protein/tetratricopeptide (TPR) repeat protein